MIETNEQLVDFLSSQISNSEQFKATFSNPRKKSDLKSIAVKKLIIKSEEKLQFVYKYETNDVAKNYTLPELLEDKTLTEMVLEYRQIHVMCDSVENVIRIAKKGKITASRTDIVESMPTQLEHDRKKKRFVPLSEEYLKHLGITDANGDLKPTMADKYRQINKYIEIIESHLSGLNLTGEVKVIDMGSGKGYLTFALYSYLKQKFNVKVVGVELRQNMVTLCNGIAEKCGFTGLTFEAKRIEDYEKTKVDILIALHACDTATDDALAFGIKADAELIICAPCCHKQIRREIENSKTYNSITKNGIFLERTCEMVTDTIRSLVLEDSSYKTKIFEFVSNEHTRKNIMLSATKRTAKTDKEIGTQIKNLKQQYGIGEHYLETLLQS